MNKKMIFLTTFFAFHRSVTYNNTAGTRGVMMKQLLIVLSMLCFLSACGGGSGATNTDESDISDFLNGSTSVEATSYWSCTDNGGNSYSLWIFEDGTGYSTSIGLFTWSETGNGSISITYDGGTSVISNISAAIVPKATFIQDGTLNADCTLVEASASSSPVEYGAPSGEDPSDSISYGAEDITSCGPSYPQEPTVDLNGAWTLELTQTSSNCAEAPGDVTCNFTFFVDEANANAVDISGSCKTSADPKSISGPLYGTQSGNGLYWEATLIDATYSYSNITRIPCNLVYFSSSAMSEMFSLNVSTEWTEGSDSGTCTTSFLGKFD